MLLVMERCLTLEIPTKVFTEMFKEARKAQNWDVLQMLIQSSKLQDLEPKHLDFALKYNKLLQWDILLAVAKSNCLDDISTTRLNKLFFKAGKVGRADVLLTIIRSDRFSRIPHPIFTLGFQKRNQSRPY